MSSGTKNVEIIFEEYLDPEVRIEPSMSVEEVSCLFKCSLEMMQLFRKVCRAVP